MSALRRAETAVRFPERIVGMATPAQNWLLHLSGVKFKESIAFDRL